MLNDIYEPTFYDIYSIGDCTYNEKRELLIRFVNNGDYQCVTELMLYIDNLSDILNAIVRAVELHNTEIASYLIECIVANSEPCVDVFSDGSIMLPSLCDIEYLWLPLAEKDSPLNVAKNNNMDSIYNKIMNIKNKYYSVRWQTD